MKRATDKIQNSRSKSKNLKSEIQDFCPQNVSVSRKKSDQRDLWHVKLQLDLFHATKQVFFSSPKGEHSRLPYLGRFQDIADLSCLIVSGANFEFKIAISHF